MAKHVLSTKGRLRNTGQCGGLGQATCFKQGRRARGKETGGWERPGHAQIEGGARPRWETGGGAGGLSGRKGSLTAGVGAWVRHASRARSQGGLCRKSSELWVVFPLGAQQKVTEGVTAEVP